MKKTIVLFLLAIFSVSCIEIEEHITINPDKSGTYSLSVDLSTVALIGGQKNDDLNRIAEFPSEVAKSLSGVEGISDINAKPVNKKGVHAISFRFKNPKAFHRALMTIAGWKLGFAIPKYIRVKKHKVKKFNVAPIIRKKLKEEKTQAAIPEILYGAIFVNTVIDLPSPAKKVNNPKAKLSNGGKTVTLRSSLDEFVNGLDNGIRIRY